MVRSATKVDAGLIERAGRLRVIGRAGTGVDNVDVAAATRRGIVVCNAPESNAISAAEHAIALLLAQARNIPQAHASLVAGRWERSRFGGVEVTGKTLGVLGFGRIGQLVASRAKGLGMSVVAYDPFVADSRFRELGVERADTPEDLYGSADFITLHLASTPETRGLVGRAAFAAMRPGARVINAARGDVLDVDALVEALQSGRLGGAAVDVFPQEPTTESPLFGLPGVVVTPHLGASTAEAQDRAGVAVAEQVAAALTGGVVTSAVNIPAVSPETLEVLGPLLPLARQLGQLVGALSEGRLAPLELVYEGQVADLDTRLLTTAVLAGILHGRVEEAVNLVNAGNLARERGLEWTETTSPRARDYTNRITVRAGEVSPGRHHGGHDLAAAAGLGLRPGHRDRAGPQRRAVPLPRRARDDRPGGDPAGRGPHQRRLDGRLAQPGRRARGDGGDGGLARAPRGGGPHRGPRRLRRRLVRDPRPELAAAGAAWAGAAASSARSSAISAVAPRARQLLGVLRQDRVGQLPNHATYSWSLPPRSSSTIRAAASSRPHR